MGHVIKAIITTLDNLELLKEQAEILRADPLISEIIIVCNGSLDGTAEWLTTQPDLIPIIRENKGAGPGRNAGLDRAGEFDYVLMLDGGIRPLHGGVERMLEYLERHPEVDVLGCEIPHFETDYNKAWRRWPNPIKDTDCYRNSRLSHTAYCLSRYHAWDGLRFSEVGPFGQPGWGVDDDEMAYRWNAAGIVVHSVVNIHPYRHASGSFRRLFKETGIWPNQYGSVYEQRLVYCQQEWPQYGPGTQWDEPWLSLIVKCAIIPDTARLIKVAHDTMRTRRYPKPWNHISLPYSIILWFPEPNPEVEAWAEQRRLHQHHGNAIIVDDRIIQRNGGNEIDWTGDFRVWRGDWREAVRKGAHYYGLVTNHDELAKLFERYCQVHPDSDPQVRPAGGLVKLVL